MPDTSTRRQHLRRQPPVPRFSASYVHGLESRITLLDIGRDRVDDRVGPGYRVGD